LAGREKWRKGKNLQKIKTCRACGPTVRKNDTENVLRVQNAGENEGMTKVYQQKRRKRYPKRVRSSPFARRTSGKAKKFSKGENP